MLDIYKRKTAPQKNKFQEILTTTMLASLVIHDNLPSDVCKKDIANMKC